MLLINHTWLLMFILPVFSYVSKMPKRRTWPSVARCRNTKCVEDDNKSGMETRWRCPRTGANVDGESVSLMVLLMTAVITGCSAHLQADVFWKYEYVWRGWFGKLQNKLTPRLHPVVPKRHLNHISSVVGIRSWSSIINWKIISSWNTSPPFSLISPSDFNKLLSWRKILLLFFLGSYFLSSLFLYDTVILFVVEITFSLWRLTNHEIWPKQWTIHTFFTYVIITILA